eukprot:scaffold27367_cov112-Isochrysis_galbana.AAC.11
MLSCFRWWYGAMGGAYRDCFLERLARHWPLGELNWTRPLRLTVVSSSTSSVGLCWAAAGSRGVRGGAVEPQEERARCGGEGRKNACRQRACGGGCSCRDRAGLSLAMMAKWQEARCEIVAKDTKTRVVELVREETLRPCG